MVLRYLFMVGALALLRLIVLCYIGLRSVTVSWLVCVAGIDGAGGLVVYDELLDVVAVLRSISGCFRCFVFAGWRCLLLLRLVYC